MLPADPDRTGVGRRSSPAPACGSSTRVDVVFPVLHGRFGEDGTIQGLLEMAGVPYVGAGVFASAAAMDKEFTKKLLRAEGLPVGDVRRAAARAIRYSAVDLAALGLPVFVKPARAGSSVGITKVRRWPSWPTPRRGAFAHDDKVLIEAAVAGREIECGVLEDEDGAPDRERAGRDPAGPRTRLVRLRGQVPRRRLRVRHPGRPAAGRHRAGPGRGLPGLRRARLRRAGPRRLLRPHGRNVVVNEVNTMPGFTPISMFPRMWAATGVDYPNWSTG